MPTTAGDERSATHEARPPTVATAAAMTDFAFQGASASKVAQMPCARRFPAGPVLDPWTGYSWLLAKVSQALGSPVSIPLRSQVIRCSDDPCVQLSGLI